MKLAAPPEPAQELADDLPPAATTENELSPTQQLEHEHYELIRERTREVCEARSTWAQAKDRSQALKKEFDALSGELLDLIVGGPEMQRKLPLSDEPATVPSDAWRDVEVGELDVPDSLAAKLIENGMHTLGELSDYWKARRELTELKGIGGAKSDQVAEAFAKYGQEHPEVFGQAAEEPAAEEGDAEETDVDEEDADEGDDESEGEWSDLDE